ncbi:hypothetical protein CMO92_01170 [Candidatus Woesearchaeota archaeon]|nr:hypothetical protein [Candidatus Woesearchaeota archaeon]|tara:strand:- start:58 stop:249 length:192 start_codon:yes stop_codon:yes gene_type:complete
MNKQEYVVTYAKELKNNSALFSQQKLIIDSQIKASASFFRNMFKEEEYKKAARRYLHQRGLLK